MGASLFSVLLGLAFAAPGQRGTFHLTPDHTSWTARASVGGVGYWIVDDESGTMTALDLGAKPLHRLQLAAFVPLRQNKKVELPTVVALSYTATRPWSSVQLAPGAAVVYRGEHTSLQMGAVFSLTGQKIGWDIGGNTLAMDIGPTWKQQEGPLARYFWDWTMLASGISWMPADFLTMRFGFPDGINVSFRHSHITLDVGGASPGYIGMVHGKFGLVF